MDLVHLGKKDSRLLNLLQQSQQWRRLDARVKQIIPANLRAHFQVACIEDGCLIILAANNMASSRLRMIVPSLLPKIQNLENCITDVRIKVVPKQPAKTRINSLQLGSAAVAGFQRSAERLAHHPELAEALRKLAEKHGKF
ncbi:MULTISPECIES: DciA family protein [unclassified Neisseria]|uniref:DciA family protein n=1 Tax=unclassified Neisseria TaxID=2623750 RepID=UPI002665F654|nr:MULTISPECIES: DciA family protein [unclassified Neisseria]MDO1510446.1 DciA family protein [Neisseria sp. MVDL19-042950]MDO1516615.1 DciA family protein [Neisseria sp. MVDL18-041461]MDO1563761.1 DciA family protein [Neisseria sp. MVDL20-010259]